MKREQFRSLRLGRLFHYLGYLYVLESNGPIGHPGACVRDTSIIVITGPLLRSLRIPIITSLYRVKGDDRLFLDCLRKLIDRLLV